MPLFHEVADSAIVVRRKGFYKQCKLFQKGAQLYIGLTSNSFIMLYADGKTNIPDIMWDDIELSFTPIQGEYGRLQGHIENGDGGWQKPKISPPKAPEQKRIKAS
jgi:hypothetical protein